LDAIKTATPLTFHNLESVPAGMSMRANMTRPYKLEHVCDQHACPDVKCQIAHGFGGSVARQLLCGVKNLFRVGQKIFFQRRRVGYGRVQRSDSQQRAVQVTESFLA
jgi:hypothetical protein